MEGRLASQRGRIEFAFTTDDSVRLPLLSTPPHGDAVTVSYQAGVGLPEEDLHLPKRNTLARAPTPAEPGDLLLGVSYCVVALLRSLLRRFRFRFRDQKEAANAL